MNRRETFLNGRITLHGGDSRDVLKTLADDSIDSIVTDPPYALVSIVKRFGAVNAAAVKVPEGGSGAYVRASAGFMGKTWDTGETAFATDFWAECLRVLKPGGHVVAFSGTRTYHRMACAIEDAGFEVRDMLSWLYGSGFPKSHDVSKGIDKSLGAERSKIRVDASRARNPKATGAGRDGMEGASRPWIESAMVRGFHEAVSDEAVSDEAVEWQGWGTALKPACEPICFGRKPLIGTVAANVLEHGTGAINIDGCRVGVDPIADASQLRTMSRNLRDSDDGWGMSTIAGDQPQVVHAEGRWPANIIHDGSDEVIAAFPADLTSGKPSGIKAGGQGTAFGHFNGGIPVTGFGDTGSAARFFYTAKADADDRLGSKHPTVKPIDLMQWLCRLVTPPGGTILDPFAGTGTTGEAAFREGFNAVLIEREAEYQADIRRRMGLVLSGPDERARQSVKARLGDAPPDHGPLFGGLDTAPPREGGESTEYSRTNRRTDRIEVVNE